ncbi:MAG: ABC transporter permease [Chloroflexi bacterium]|nr:ABC transporter permease [Chloroflexota bacterium]
MSVVTHQLRATYAFVERNANLVKRYWSWEVVWLVYSIANALSISYIGLGMEQLSGADANVDGSRLALYLIIGALVWHFLSVIFYWITELISIERWEGTIEYTLMAPIHRVTHMAGQTLFAVMYSMLFNVIILMVAAPLFDIDLSGANLFGGALMLLAGSLSFIGISITASTLPLLFPERGTQMTHVIIALMLLVSGVYYPIDVLPGLLQRLAVLSPATYVLQGVRAALLEGSATRDLWPFMWPALLMGLAAIPAGLKIFGLAERYAKRTGKLHRNG